jgi:hypothetical protein
MRPSTEPKAISKKTKTAKKYSSNRVQKTSTMNTGNRWTAFTPSPGAGHMSDLFASRAVKLVNPPVRNEAACYSWPAGIANWPLSSRTGRDELLAFVGGQFEGRPTEIIPSDLPKIKVQDMEAAHAGLIGLDPMKRFTSSHVKLDPFAPVSTAIKKRSKLPLRCQRRFN